MRMREGIDAGGNYLQANLKRIEDPNGPPHSKVLHIFDRQPGKAEVMIIVQERKESVERDTYI